MQRTHLHDGKSFPSLLLLVLHRPLQRAVLSLDLLPFRLQIFDLLLKLLYPVLVANLGDKKRQ